METRALWRGGLGCLLATTMLWSAEAPNAWQYAQPLAAPRPGLTRIALPIETLGAARPELEDLRLLDPSGREVPYLLEHSRPGQKVVGAAKSVQVTLTAGGTVILVETGLQQPLEGVSLSSPAVTFIKAVKVEASKDRTQWRTLAEGLPIYRQASGASQLHLPLPPDVWPYLRLTVNDDRSAPIPFTGVQVHGTGDPGKLEPLALTLAERTEDGSQTRLTLNLPAPNLRLAVLEVETPDPLFTRQVTAMVRQATESGIRETPVARGTIYRFALGNQPVSTNLAFSVEAQVPSRELTLTIDNQDSPPLQGVNVKAWRRPVELVFLAPVAGEYSLLTGHSRCAAPRYDLAALGASMRSAEATLAVAGRLTTNQAYRPPETLPTVPEGGAAIEVAAWKCRKALRLARSGAQQLELDPETLARAQPDLSDLRLVRGNQQLPFVFERASLTRELSPTMTLANDSKQPRLSRWALALPRRALPLVRLSCACSTPLFQRQMVLYEEVADERGELHRQVLGQASWMRKPGDQAARFFLELNHSPTTEVLILETNNEDNPPIRLEAFRVAYPVTRLLFKATSTAATYLYYGNQRASAAQYDLALVAGELLAAEKAVVTLGPEEELKPSGWPEHLGGQAGRLLWVVLGAVVVGLLWVIARLAPKAQPPGAGTSGG